MKFFDIREYLNDLKPISIIIGGRGIGKTYSALSFMIENNEPFIYMRNTKEQIEICSEEFGNPFKRLNLDKGYNIHFAGAKKHVNIIDMDNDNKIIGYAASLSTFENLRGIDLSEVKYILFDEFIENRKLMFDQFKTFINMVETVSRNREILGEEPLKIILLSNSQSLNSPILMGYNLVPLIEKMLINGQHKLKRGDILIMLPESEISEAKKNTSTYKSLKGTRIYEENINNKFANDSFFGIKTRNLREYIPVCKVDDLYLYKHKSNNLYYVCSSQALNIPEYSSRDNALAFYQSYGRYMPQLYSTKALEFSDFTVKAKFMKIIE